MAGPTALPRQSGELLFQDPWEGIAFALAVALCERDHFAWAEFQQRLTAAIGDADRQPPDARPTYYECWLNALQAVLVDKAIVAQTETHPARRLAGQNGRAPRLTPDAVVGPGCAR